MAHPLPRRPHLLFCMVLLSCADAGSDTLRERGDVDDVHGPAHGRTVSTSFVVRESVEQLHVTRAAPGTELEVVDGSGARVAAGAADVQGSLIFRKLAPGQGYAVHVVGAAPADFTDGLRVWSVADSLPDESFYASQKLEPGFGYITTRDGTRLSVFVSLPGPPEDGPYPTVVNYSGYSPSQPGVPLEGAEKYCSSFPVLCDAPRDQSALIAGLMGYASVGVNMRGTGCSGGAYDYWETLQVLDGYDAIEVVAQQDWVLHGEVGMTGLSYPGISQLFVAQARPPHLAAITPMSVIADTSTSTLAPGGIFNEGFAFRWAEGVLNGAEPYGRGFERAVVEAEKARDGTSICEENQLLHSQVVDAIAKARANPFYSDELAKPLDPSSFVGEIDVPVFLGGQWQDEQTGPHFAALLDRFTSAPIARFSVTNGVHPDGFAPQVLGEWKTFLDLYVAKRVPTFDAGLRLVAPELFRAFFEEPLALPENRFADYTSYADALADYEAEPPLRVVFESGANPELDKPGAPLGTFEQHFEAWPIPGTKATRFFLQPGGGLAAQAPPQGGGGSSFEHDAEAGKRTSLAAEVGSSDEVWKTAPRYDYRPLVEGKAIAFESEPLAADVVMLGHGSADLFLQSTADDADLEITLTEVRADGNESYVQSGFLRASQRKLRADASDLRPTHTHREEDVAPLPRGQWELVRVELMPFGHVFRAGSRIRLSVDTPGDNHAAWTFILLEHEGTPVHTVAHDAAHPSSLVLPVVEGVEIPSSTPPCEALRGQPCRAHVAVKNAPM